MRIAACWTVSLLLLSSDAAAKGRPPDRLPLRLAADTTLRSTSGPVRVRRGTVLVYNPGDGAGRTTPATPRSRLARGVLAGTQILAGVELADGTEVTFYDPPHQLFDDGFIIPLARPRRFGPLLLRDRARFEDLEAGLLVSGVLAEEAIVDGVPLAAGEEAGVLAASGLGFGVVARDHALARGGRVIPLAKGDHVSTLARFVGGEAQDGDRLLVRFAGTDTVRVLEGKYPARGHAQYWPDGALRELYPAAEVVVNGVAAATRTILFHDDGSPKLLVAARPARLQGRLVGREDSELTFWPSGKLLCADAAEGDPALAGERHHATIYFDPGGTPRLLAVDDEQSRDLRFELTPGERAIGPGHPLHERFYRGCRDPGDRTWSRLVAWLAAGGPGPAPPRPIAPFPRAVSSVGRRPTFRWALAPGSDGARLEVCADHQCRGPIATHDVQGASFRPPAALPPRARFWRLRGRAGTATGAVEGPVWRLGGGQDVDGDGYGDLVASGRRLILGGGVPAPAEKPAIELGVWDDLAIVGDVDGDGRADLVHGAPDCGPPAKRRPACGHGKAHLYLGGRLAMSLEQPAGATGTGFGVGAVGLGDLDGDGHGEVGLIDATGAHVFRGGPRGLEARPVHSIPALALVAAGDVDGDGFDDLVAGGPSPRLFAGGASGPTPARALPAHDFTAAGDFNGDGFSDLALGTLETGRIIVLDGGAGGLAARPSATITVPTHADRQYPGPVVAAGDLDGDGADDLVALDACARLKGGACDGIRAYVHKGGPRGAGRRPAIALDPERRVMGIPGGEIVPAGLLDGDGYADFVLSGNVYTGGRWEIENTGHL